jgi:hypothetical protein
MARTRVPELIGEALRPAAGAASADDDGPAVATPNPLETAS